MSLSTPTDFPSIPAIFKSLIHPAVLVGSLGYFVDIFDLILFAAVRGVSLTDLGCTKDQLVTQGSWLINVQMGGMLLGGLLWGLLGDWRGRISILFGSIVLYSLANLANGFVHDLSGYTVCRFVAGIGLAGELGGCITLVAEVLPRNVRGYGTMMISAIGVLGAVVAGGVVVKYGWRHAYMIGGGLGLAVLLLRITVKESHLFKALDSGRRFGSQLLLLFQPRRIGHYLCCILIGLPCWYVIGLIVVFSPEFAAALGTRGPVTAPYAVAVGYTGICLGDLASGAMSQLARTRKRVLLLFMVATLVLTNLFFFQHAPTNLAFYLMIFLLGISVGYWAVFVTVAAEHFGTNLRATVATTVPNFSRAAVIPITTAFAALKPAHGALTSGLAIGWVTLLLAFIGLHGLRETFHDELDYTEE